MASSLCFILPSWSLHLCSAIALLPVPDGRSYRLNDRFPLMPGGDISAFEVSADGAWIAYVADAEADDVAQLYSVPVAGTSAPLRLAEQTSGNGIHALTITPDGTRVLYSDTLQVPRRLFSVPIDGSAPPVELVGEHAKAFGVTADSTRVVFVGDIITPDRFLLCSMPVDGSAPPIVLNAPLPAGVDVRDFELSADGTRVAFRADALFSAPVDAAGAALQLDGVVEDDYRIGGTRVVYRVDPPSNDVIELYSAPLDGSAAPVRLCAPLGGSRDVESGFELSPDGTRVLYLADQTTNDVIELFSVPIDGSTAPVQLSPTPVSGGDVQPGLSASAARAFFRGDLVTDRKFELFSAPLDGSAPAVRLSGTLASDEDIRPEFELAPNGTRVAFLVGQGNGATLSSAPADGSAAPVTLAQDPAFLPDELTVAVGGQWLYYRKSEATGSRLWCVPLAGGAPALALSGGDSLGQFRLILGGAGALYTADEDQRSVLELFARPASAAVPSFQLSPEFPDNVVSGRVEGFRISGNQVVFLADEAGMHGLYSTPISGHGAQLLISDTSGTPLDVSDFELGDGGTRAVFLATIGALGIQRELYSARIDGSGPAVRISGPMQSQGTITHFLLSGDGSHALYIADQDEDEVSELYRTRVDGSQNPVKLSGTMVSGGDVQSGFSPDFLSSFDGSRAFFVADRETDNVLELYTADGSSPPVKLSGPLGPLGDVQFDIQLSSDEAWVFFRADATTDGYQELFRVPSDGSSAAQKISGSGLRSPGVLEDGYRITPDATRVVFLAYEASFGPPSAFTAPADASAPPQRLNSGTSGFRGVRKIELDPTGTTAVFHNDHGGERLLAVPVDGSAPDQVLTPLAANQGVREDNWRISPDGARVLYMLDIDSCCADLYSVPIGGGARTRLDSLPIDPYLTTFEIDAASELVAFLDSPANRLFLVPINGSSAPVEIESSVTTRPTFTPDGSALLFLRQARQTSYDLHVSLLKKAPRSSGPPR